MSQIASVQELLVVVIVTVCNTQTKQQEVKPGTPSADTLITFPLINNYEVIYIYLFYLFILLKV